MFSKTVLKRAVLAALGVFLLIQVVPYGRSHANPPVTRAARWPAGPGEQIAEQSCYDCHSNLTKWRWYSNVAPVSWLVQHDVEDGRGVLDFSEWHKGASLSSSEKSQLVSALSRLYATDPPPPGGG